MNILKTFLPILMNPAHHTEPANKRGAKQMTDFRLKSSTDFQKSLSFRLQIQEYTIQ